jgi:hypothetical protein
MFALALPFLARQNVKNIPYGVDGFPVVYKHIKTI